MRPELQTVFVDWGLESYIHGMAKIFRKNNTLAVKVTWLVCFLLCFSLCVGLLVKNFSDYFTFEVATKIEVLHENPAVFPKVTICNYNMFATDYSINFLRAVQASLPDQTPDIFKKYAPFFLATNMNETDKKKLGFQVEVSLEAQTEVINLELNKRFLHKGTYFLLLVRRQGVPLQRFQMGIQLRLRQLLHLQPGLGGSLSRKDSEPGRLHERADPRDVHRVARRPWRRCAGLWRCRLPEQ